MGVILCCIGPYAKNGLKINLFLINVGIRSACLSANSLNIYIYIYVLSIMFSIECGVVNKYEDVLQSLLSL